MGHLVNSTFQSQLLRTMLAAILLNSSVSLAQSSGNSSVNSTSSQNQTSVTQVKTEADTKNGFSMGLGIEYSQKVATEELGQREKGTDFTFLPSYKINETFGIGAKAIITKEQSGQQETKASNTQLSLSIKGFQINDSLKSIHAITVALPTSEESKERDRLYGQVGVSNGLSLTTKYLLAEYKLGLSKNTHEYTVNAENTPNVEYRISNSLELKLLVTEQLYLSTLGIYRYGRTYAGFERTAFEIHSDINYDVNDKLSFNLGVSNDGNALKANGVDSNISAYDENNSSVRLGLSLTL